jgi:hypothetical protein
MVKTNLKSKDRFRLIKGVDNKTSKIVMDGLYSKGIDVQTHAS